MKGGGAQTKHKATGITSHLWEIDLVLMPTNIDGLAGWKSQNTRPGFSELWLLFYPLRNLWCCRTTEEEHSSSLWINKTLLQFRSDKHPLCARLCQLLADCGWPCLAPEELVRCHVCTLTGSKAGTEGLKVFDDHWSKETKIEKALWRNGFHPFSLYLSISINFSCYDDA